nr:immunoglobulin light chain junction region [Macaca mulatta]
DYYCDSRDNSGTLPVF